MSGSGYRDDAKHPFPNTFFKLIILLNQQQCNPKGQLPNRPDFQVLTKRSWEFTHLVCFMLAEGD